jgi:NAD(P)-dependent dehydrogenase (short-subunit alcohol dehydrogenase family)
MTRTSDPAATSASPRPVALVTGASAGIGAAVVGRLLAGGWTVYAAARRADRMAPLARAGARLLALDVTDDAAMVAAVDRLLAETGGRLDALVNNAGYGAYGALEDVPLAEGRRQFEVNVFGLARLTQLVLPAMRRHVAGGRGRGRVVNVSSIGGRIHEPMGSWYHATKFAVEGLSDCLRMELAPFGIDVVVIQPGAVRTEWSGIARDGLLRTSGATAYAGQARQTAALLAGADAGSGADPSVVADAVWRAVTARRPRTRYAMGGGARPLLALRWLLSDRAFDAVMRAAASRMGRGAAVDGAPAPGGRSDHPATLPDATSSAMGSAR